MSGSGSPRRGHGRWTGGEPAAGGARRAPRPGWVNAHTHLYAGLAGLGMPAPPEPPRTFLEILERVWWRLDRALDERSLRAAARLHAAEALLAGTTALVDHHESPGMIEGSLEVLADACQELGVRAVLCYGATERNGGRDEAEAGLAECRRFARSNARPLVRGMVGLHASFTVSDETLAEAGRLARELGIGVHVHVAEDAADVEDARRRGHPDPLARLLACGALPPGSILAHGVHLDEAAVRRADAAGLWIVQNPRSNAGNRVGYPRALWASARVALGTDGHPADLRAELDALVRAAAAAPDERASASRLVERAEAGRRLLALHFDEADLARDQVVLDDTAGSGRPRVATVRVAGRTVVADGRLVHADLAEVRAAAAAAAPALWARMEALPWRA
uniref:Amidohydrolase n=1 Tax=Eiseniibacteriota bacterium TaxID=2212470 RepID=A0A832I5W8_UNCEI